MPLLTLALTLLLALLLTRLTIGIELALQILEGFVAQPLLLSQGFGQALHRLLAFGLALLTLLALGDLHVLHHLAQLVE